MRSLLLAPLRAFRVFRGPSPALPSRKSGEPLPGTEPLTMEGDIAAQMVAGIDKFLLREIDLSVERREKHWKRDFSSPEAYNKSIEPNRQRLAKILGVVDERVPFDAPELVGTTKQSALVGSGENYEIFAVRWPAVREVHGEGLLLVPKGEKVADIIAIPDADQTPEQICGLADGVPPESQFARRLAENGCRVLVPTLISREMAKRAPPGQPGRANLTNREYRLSPGVRARPAPDRLRVQKVLAGVDWFAKEAGEQGRRRSASSATAKAACSRFTPAHLTRESTPLASAATSARANESGSSRLTAMCLACSSNLAMRNCARWSRRERLSIESSSWSRSCRCPAKEARRRVLEATQRQSQDQSNRAKSLSRLVQGVANRESTWLAFTRQVRFRRCWHVTRSWQYLFQLTEPRPNVPTKACRSRLAIDRCRRSPAASNRRNRSATRSTSSPKAPTSARSS